MLFAAFIFICSYPVVMAPTIDFRLRFQRIKYISEYLDRKYHEAEFARFINDLGKRESGNNWQCINLIGCFGEWQFAESTVRYLGFKNVTLKKFRANPEIFPRELQQKALESLIKVNLALLKDYDHYIGDTIKGVVITRSGMIAASHLGGARSLKLYLASNGRINKKDVLGTSIHNYLKKFCFYDL